MEAVDRKTVSTIRALCADTVEKGKFRTSGTAFEASILIDKLFKRSGLKLIILLGK